MIKFVIGYLLFVFYKQQFIVGHIKQAAMFKTHAPEQRYLTETESLVKSAAGGIASRDTCYQSMATAKTALSDEPFHQPPPHPTAAALR